MTTSVRNRLIIVAVAIVAAVVLLLPTFFPEQVSGGRALKPLRLGLDLLGGVHLVYEVKASEAVRSRLQSVASGMRAKLRDEKISARTSVLSDNRIEVMLSSSRRAEDARRIVETYDRGVVPVSAASDGEGFRIVVGVSPEEALRLEEQAMVQAVETLRNRVDQFGVAEPLIQRTGARRILLQMPGIQDINAVKRVVGSVAKLEFRIVTRPGEDGISFRERDGGSIDLGTEPLMTGDAVDTASAHFMNGQMEVLLGMTTEGGRLFRRITQENVGRQLAIVLDGVVYSAPQIRERIAGGSASISGGFSADEANQLAVILRSGALPAPLQIVEERTVGPTLGRESIEKGIVAITIGVSAVFLFMVVYYRKAGALASFTLALNVLFLLAMLSAFGATLTLPGMAALALTVGMAVDSNVIIFERIRDELRNGATRDAAVTAGFDRAYSALIDANVTTLIAGLVLYLLGSGPIRGFAVALSLGVISTIFCAVFVARVGFDALPLRGRKELSI